MMKHVLLFVSMAALISGCGAFNRLTSAPKAPPVEIVAPVEETVTLPAMGAGQAAAALDQTSAAEKAAATAPATTGARELGRTSVALGSPAEQGFWLKSPLVAAAGKGRVTTASGASVAVDLQPGSGGSLLSLAAYRALGLALTDLPEVTVAAE
jgi:hypothetical protein